MKRSKEILSIALTALVCLCLLLWFALSVGSISSSGKEAGIRRLEESLRRGAVAIYAQEGRYPDSYEDICEKYSIRVDKDYRVEYDIFAENVMPDIRVAAR